MVKKIEKKVEKEYENNKMREAKIEKVILSCGGVKDVLDKSVKLLKKLSKKTPKTMNFFINYLSH